MTSSGEVGNRRVNPVGNQGPVGTARLWQGATDGEMEGGRGRRLIGAAPDWAAAVTSAAAGPNHRRPFPAPWVAPVLNLGIRALSYANRSIT